MTLKFFFVFLLFNIIISTNSYGQKDFRFESITIDDGLSENSIISINQDQKGFLWLGTYAGLNRFDGYHLKVFDQFKIHDQEQTLSNIFDIEIDQQNKIWFCSIDELYYYIPQIDQFFKFDYLPDTHNNLNKEAIRAIEIDQDSILWIGSFGNGLYSVDLKTGKKNHFKHDPQDQNSLASNLISALYLDKKNNLWIATEGGLELYNKQERNFIHHQHDPDKPYSISSNKVVSICEDSYDCMWVGTWGGGLNCLNLQTKKFTHYFPDPDDPFSLSGLIIRSLFEDSRKNLWIGTHLEGLCLYNRKEDNFFQYSKKTEGLYGLKSNIIVSFFEDSTGVVWIGTEFGGLGKIDFGKNRFSHYQVDPTKNMSLTNSNAKSILVDHSHGHEVVMIGTNGGGLNIVDRSDDTVYYFKQNDQDSNSIAGNQIMAFLKDSNDHYWMGTNAGFSKFNLKTKKFVNYSFEDVNDLYHTDVYSIMQDHDHNIWLSVFNCGLIKYDENLKNHTQYIVNIENTITDKVVWDLVQDYNNYIWIATDVGGLNCYDPGSDRFYYLTKDNHKKNSLKSNKVFTLLIDSDSVLWAGTSNGLVQIDLRQFKSSDFSQPMLENAQIKSYQEKDGLCNNVVHCVIEDHNHDLWISTTRGLSLFYKEEEEFRNFYKSDGLLSDQFLVNSLALSEKGEVFLGSVEGVTFFYPDSLKPNLIQPKLVFTKFSLFNREINIGDTINNRILLKKSLNELNEIKLFYKENSFTIDFSALHFNSPEKNQYAYQMEGFDPDWIYTNRRHATYTNLSPGEYRFKVKASNPDGIWNEKGIGLVFRIIPPFWITLWFRILLFFSLSAVVVAFFMLRIRRINKNRLELRQKVKERTKELLKKSNELELQSKELAKANSKLENMDRLKNDFIANVTHDFRSPLMVIINIADLAAKYGKDLSNDMKKRFDLIYNAGLKLGSTIDRLLDISKMDSHGIKLKVKKVPIRSLIEDLTDFYSSTVSTTSNIEVQAKLPMSEIDNVYTDQEKLEEVLNNIISNAIKFVNMDSGKISILLDDLGDKVAIKIIDNGKGIPSEKLDSIFNRFEQVDGGMDSVYKGTGIGLAFAKQLTGYLKGNIYAQSEGLGKGSQFVVELQKGKEIFDEKDLVQEVEFKETIKEKANLKRLLSMELDEKAQSRRSMISLNNLNQENEFDYKKGKILIVDDNPNIREIMVEYLLNNGYENFIVMFDGIQGMKAAYDYLPDLIICDYNMPNMRGDEMHDQLFNNPNFKHVPFIFLSAVADKNIILERTKKGAIAYLPKPVDEKELVLTVELHLKKYMDFKSTFMMSTVDELTTLYNKRYINQLLSDHLAFREYKDLSVLFLDIDHFKSFNDNYGHQLGDLVLHQTGQKIKNSLREYDRAGRFGGEEFLIILPETPLKNAIFAAEKLNRLIKETKIEYENKELTITTSVGIVSLKDHEEELSKKLGVNDLRTIFEIDDPKNVDWDRIKAQKVKIKEFLVKMADDALYMAKTTTCNRCGFSTTKDVLFVDESCPECDSTDLDWGRDKIVVYPLN